METVKGRGDSPPQADGGLSQQASGNATTKGAFCVPLAMAALIAFFLPLGLFRFIDGDEGYILMGARLVSEGRVPYADFFSPQMPLTSYVYGFWFKVFGANWVSGRILSVLMGIGIGLLLYLGVLRSRRSHQLALLAAVLFASSSLSFGWFPIAKTYALSTLLLFGAYVVTTHAKNPNSQLRLLFGGIMFGLAGNTRLYLLATLPAFGPCLLDASWTWASVRRRLGWFLLDAFLALLPDLYFLLEAPDEFLHGTIGYHLVRSELSLMSGLAQKLWTGLSRYWVFSRLKA
jgi:hypothetical protein